MTKKRNLIKEMAPLVEAETNELLKIKRVLAMEAKYYTPSIEEFHVGFEYEFRSTNDQTEPWQKSVIDDGTQIDDITRQIIGGRKVYELRVKYLDREDIESLGFVKGDGPWWNRPDGYQLSYGDSMVHTHAMITKSTTPDGELDYYFRGFIRNKSELKRILTQVGIA